MQTDDIIFSAIETCAVAEVHDNFEIAIKTEKPEQKTWLNRARKTGGQSMFNPSTRNSY